MKKIISILIALSLIFSTPAFAQFSFSLAPPTPEYTANEVLDNLLMDITVSLTMLGDGIGSCSGTLIYEDDKNQYVLTAKHCIDVTEEIYVEETKALYTIASADDDLALVVIPGKLTNKSVAKLGYVDLKINTEVHYVAYPIGIVYKASGKITKNTNDWQIYNFQAIPGCSGGGIFNNNGRLVGVVFGAYPETDPDAPIKSVGEPLKDVKIFLKTVLPEVLK